MVKRFLFFTILFLSLFLSNCKTHEDNSFRNALYLYSVNCVGGSADSCRSACNNKCGVPAGSAVTSDKLYCMNSCQDSCATSCDLSTAILLYLAAKPLK
jgi:hypothetical protein